MRTIIVLILPVALSLAACASNRIPDRLDTMESEAEDAYDLALAGNVKKVQTVSQQLDQDWQAFRGQAAKDGASEMTLQEVDRALAGVHIALDNSDSGARLARTVNQVSAPMPALFHLYGPKVPSSILALDYLGREVALDGMLEESPASHLTELDNTWSHVRPDVVSHGGEAEAQVFDQHLADLRAAADANRWDHLTETANVLLEDVDALEDVF